MHFHSIKRRLLCIFIAISFFFWVAPCSMANENKEETMRQLNKALSSLPQTEAKKKIDGDLKKIYAALDISIQQVRDKEIKDYLSHTINHFYNRLSSESDETVALLNQWNEHLFDITRFSNIDFCIAIKSQQLAYYKAITNFNEKLEEIEINRKNYSPQWIDELNKRFGKDFTKQNRKEILNNFLAIMNSSYRSYEEDIKNLIYKEAMLYGSYKEYFGTFLDYYKNTLEDEGKKVLASRKNIAEALLSLINDISITSLYDTNVLYEKMANNQAQYQNAALYSFFRELSKTSNFNLVRANEDLQRVMGGNQ